MTDTELLRIGASRADLPLVVTGLGSAAVLAATGDIALSWEARGAILEWGGVYAQGVRLTGPWTVRFDLGEGELTVPATLGELRATRGRVDSVHRIGPLLGRQRIVPHPEAPAVLREWEFENVSGREVSLWVHAEWTPFLSPVIVEAFKPYEYLVERVGGATRFTSGSYTVSFVGDPAPTSWQINGAPWSGERSEGEVTQVRCTFRLTIPAEGHAKLAWVVWGGLSKLQKAEVPDEGRGLLDTRASWSAAAAEVWTAWLDATPKLTVPDAPGLQHGYDLARSALRALYTRPEPELHGLVAGYPWYSTIWCRDLAWSLPAVLWMGDLDWARRSVESVFRFQAPEPILILSAEKGELPMQLSAGPVFIFGTSDTTHHYPDLVRRLVEHGGDLSVARSLYPAVERAIAWGRARVHPETHLVRNGGELERMMALAKMTGRFEYGIDAHDTTIWDSVDRRDHAVDVQVLWRDALAAYRRLSELLGEAPNAAAAAEEGEQLTRAVRARYGWPEERYLVDSLKDDGTASRRLRPNALRAVRAGLVEPDRVEEVVRRAFEPDLFTEWGMRTLGAHDPGFVPTSYHDGQVWTIATAWGAEAAFAAGDAPRGVRCLEVIAERLVAENGFANECYRGDRADPYNSCFLLGFSVGPFLTNVFEGLWGLEPMAPEGRLRVRPNLPPDWHEAHLESVRFGRGRIDLHYRPGTLRIRWSGPGSLSVDGPNGTLELAAGTEGSLPLSAPAKMS